MLDMLLSGPAIWFGVPAIAGSALFLIRMILMLAGGHHGVEVHAHDLPADHHGSIDHHSDDNPALAFKLLSLQAITAFAMGFGWAGLAALHGFHKPMFSSFLFAVLGGVAMIWVLMLLLKAVNDLQSSGSIPLDAAVGCEGDVYANVPAKGQGMGQVRVVVSDRMRIYNAQSADEAVPTASKIRVLAVNEDNTLTIVPI